MARARELEAIESSNNDLESSVLLENEDGSYSNEMMQDIEHMIAEGDKNKRFRATSRDSHCAENYPSVVQEELNEFSFGHPPSPSVPSSPAKFESDASCSMDEILLQFRRVIDNLALAYGKWREEGDMIQDELSNLLKSNQKRRARLSKQLAGICDSITAGSQQADEDGT